MKRKYSRSCCELARHRGTMIASRLAWSVSFRSHFDRGLLPLVPHIDMWIPDSKMRIFMGKKIKKLKISIFQKAGMSSSLSRGALLERCFFLYFWQQFDGIWSWLRPLLHFLFSPLVSWIYFSIVLSRRISHSHFFLSSDFLSDVWEEGSLSKKKDRSELSMWDISSLLSRSLTRAVGRFLLFIERIV